MISSTQQEEYVAAMKQRRKQRIEAAALAIATEAFGPLPKVDEAGFKHIARSVVIGATALIDAIDEACK